MLAADDIVLDFKGHSATSDARLQAGVRTPRGAPKTWIPKALPSIVPRNLTIRNGTIEVSRHGMAIEVFGIGPEQVLANIVEDASDEDYPQYRDTPKLLSARVAYENKERAQLRATFMPNAATYPVRNLHIENMHIHSQEYAVVLQGAGSVIRDSVIETDSGTALWLYGPNAVIENNTIIVHCIPRPISYQGGSTCDDMDAPIRLQHGDGSVIRNNHFILREQAKPRVLSLFDTGSITFEGNTFTGLDDPEKAIEVFRGPRNITTKVPNQSDNSPAALLKAWFK